MPMADDVIISVLFDNLPSYDLYCGRISAGSDSLRRLALSSGKRGTCQYLTNWRTLRETTVVALCWLY